MFYAWTLYILQSAHIGPGPELERVLFNLEGQSPLVAHYLRMRQLRQVVKEVAKCAERSCPVKSILVN